jgi:dTMP kinase
MDGTFISFEGIDGAGKSTHIERLADALRAQGRAVTLTREPGGTPLAERIRTLVLNEPMDPMTEALLVFAARRDHICNVIAPALERGEVVLCDRFTDATFAYQGGGRGFDWNTLKTLEAWVQGPGPTLQPEVTFWFDLPTAIAAQRLTGARVPDKFESQPHLFFEKVAAAYARRSSEAPQRFARIDANQPPDVVWTEVLNVARGRGLLDDR